MTCELPFLFEVALGALPGFAFLAGFFFGRSDRRREERQRALVWLADEIRRSASDGGTMSGPSNQEERA